MERFHDTLDRKLVVLVEITSFLIGLIQTYYQFAYTNIIKLFNVAIKPQKILDMNEDYSSIYKKIGQVIKEKRKEKGLTQQQLADLIPKMDRAKISDMENGKEDFHISTLIKISFALKTELQIILKELPKNNR